MIGANHDGLMDRPGAAKSSARLGGPLLVMTALFAVWISGRAMIWENPYTQNMVAQASRLLAENSAGSVAPPLEPAFEDDGAALQSASFGGLASHDAGTLRPLADQGLSPSFNTRDAHLAAGHFQLWQAALTSGGRGDTWRSRREQYGSLRGKRVHGPVFPGQPPMISESNRATEAHKADHWSLGAWVFGREGSVGSTITPGPAPVYGASQMGASLQYRFVPGRAQDPRAYVRATRALIAQGETEIAAGLSARPLGQFPVRVAAEARVTNSAFGSDVRPAAFAITELAPQALPLGLSAEAYAAGGYVGGEADTFFADGLATVTRDLASFDLRRVDDVRVSVGAGAWGGAQRGVHRVDVGPTLRVDMALGSVPARVSIDYRERVGGEATPTSGVAATLSTQF